MAEPVPQLSIVIPTHNRRALMAQMLAALAAQRPDTPVFEVIAVADGCHDDTVAMLRNASLPFALRVVELPGLGPAHARNAGSAEARAALLLFLDDDVLPAPGLVAAHTQCHAADPGGVVIGPYPPAPHRARDHFRRAMQHAWNSHFDTLAAPGHRFTYRDLLTGNLSLSRDLWNAVGGLDPQFLRAREDLELGVRLMAHGARFHYAPGAFAWHYEHATASPRSAVRRALEEGRSDARMAAKHPHMLPALPEMRRALWNRHRRIFRLPGGRDGRLADWTARALLPALWLLARMGSQRRFSRLYGRIHRFSYASGVVHALSQLPPLTPGPAVPDEPLTIDIGMGLDQAEAQLSRERPDAVRLLLDGAELALLPRQPGAEPWDGRHLRPALVERCGARLIEAIVQRELAAAGGALRPQMDGFAWQSRRFDLLLAEADLQWARAGIR